MLSGAVIVPGCNPLLLLGVVVGLLNSECPQQYRAYESKYGANGQHIELQGKVHGSASLVDAARLARNERAPKVHAVGPALFAGKIAYRTCAMDNRLIVRLKKSEGSKILMVQNSRDAEFFMANLRQIPSILRGNDFVGFATKEILAVNQTARHATSTICAFRGQFRKITSTPQTHTRA